MAAARIFSVGHSTHELEELLRLLRAVGVEQMHYPPGRAAARIAQPRAPT